MFRKKLILFFQIYFFIVLLNYNILLMFLVRFFNFGLLILSHLHLM